MSCDKSQNIPTGLGIVLQKLSNEINSMCMCWRVNDSGPNSISTTIVDPMDIVINKGGIVDMDGARWAIYSYDDAISNKPADIEKYIYTGSKPAIPVSSHIAAKIAVLKSCSTAKAQPDIISSKKEDKTFTPTRGKLNMPSIGLRVSNINKNYNWYKQAQATGFNPELLNDPSNLTSMTKEQLDAAKAWVENQDSWLNDGWTDAQKPSIEMIENDAKFNALKERAPAAGDRAAKITASTEGFNKIITLCSSMKSSIENIFVQLGSNVTVACPIPSAITKPNINSIDSIRSLYNIVQMNFGAVNAELLKINTVSSSEARAPSVMYICQTYHSLTQAVDMQNEARAYIDSVISDPSHEEYNAAITFLNESNKDSGRTPQKTEGLAIG